MLWKTLLVLGILLMLGQFFGFKISGFINILFITAIVVLVVRFFQGQSES